MTRTSFLCPTCLDHPVEVTSAGFAATAATVTGCPAWGDLVTSIEVPASQPLTWVSWADVLAAKCDDLPRWCSPCRKAFGL
jgi:hypothetical protein